MAQGGSALGFILITSVGFFRQRFYEIFLRSHQAFAFLLMYALWRHTQSSSFSSRLYIYIATGTFGATTLIQWATIVFRNFSFNQMLGQAKITKKNGLINVSIAISRPWKIRAGQYIDLWIPHVNLWSSHPFMIVSWTEGTEPALYLLIEPKHGFTQKLLSIAKENSENNLDWNSTSLLQADFHMAWFSGPHGFGAPVGEYGSVLMIATDIGIAAQLPYLKELMNGLNHCEVRTRRIHLVWQLKRKGNALKSIA